MVHLEVLQAEPFPILMGITGNVTLVTQPGHCSMGSPPGQGSLGTIAGRQAAPSSGLIQRAGLDGKGKLHSDACRERSKPDS